MSEIICPADSSKRELLAEPLIAVEEESEHFTNSTADITEEIFSQCCLNKKCICNLCHIPDCHNNGEVVVELVPESIDMPGYCCGKYECQLEPNCTEVHDTDSYWLTDCQRCKCYGGQRLCHQSCDEGFKKPAMCHSKNLNKFYEHGQNWKDGCYVCECINGEANCMITFCRGLTCPKQRQVMLKDSCCPVCWPKGFPMPNAEDEEYDEDAENDNEVESGNHYDDDHLPAANDYNENVEELEADLELKPINDITNTTDIMPTSIATTNSTLETTTTTTVSSTTISSTTSKKVILAETTTSAVELIKPPSTTVATTLCKYDNLSSTAATPEPCNRQEVPATYQVYPRVIELSPYNQKNDLLYTIIGCLSVIVVMLAAWNIHLKAKQRSYRPVSNFDDNFNRMSSNIKKMNDYV